MVEIEDCGDDADLIRDQQQQACESTGTITDDELRDCIRTKLCVEGRSEGTIECETDCDEGVLGYNRWFTFFGLFKVSASDTVHLCMNNIEGAGYEDRIWEILLHEFAHSCCWSHGDGKGVPGNSGRL